MNLVLQFHIFLIAFVTTAKTTEKKTPLYLRFNSRAPPLAAAPSASGRIVLSGYDVLCCTVFESKFLFSLYFYQ